MRLHNKKRLHGLGKTFLFYGEVIGFAAAWFVAMWVASRQPTTTTPGAAAEQFASADASIATPSEIR